MEVVVSMEGIIMHAVDQEVINTENLSRHECVVLNAILYAANSTLLEYAIEQKKYRRIVEWLEKGHPNRLLIAEDLF